MKPINVICPQGGLCNRLRAIAGVLELGEMARAKTIVLWSYNLPECGCRLSKLIDMNYVKGRFFLYEYHNPSLIIFFLDYYAD